MATSEREEAVVLQVARLHLHLTDLATRGRDRLDFHEFSVEAIKRALTAAFKGGYAVAQDEAKRKQPRRPHQRKHKRAAHVCPLCLPG